MKDWTEEEYKECQEMDKRIHAILGLKPESEWVIGRDKESCMASGAGQYTTWNKCQAEDYLKKRQEELPNSMWDDCLAYEIFNYPQYTCSIEKALFAAKKMFELYKLELDLHVGASGCAAMFGMGSGLSGVGSTPELAICRGLIRTAEAKELGSS